MLCDNSWIDISWDGQANRKRSENLSVKFNQTCAKILPYQQACDMVADAIATKYNNIYVAFSGGSDSENVCNAFLRNNIPFTPLILNYDHVRDASQRLEKWFGEQWCKRNKVTPKIVDVGTYVNSKLDLQNFNTVRPRLNGGISTAGALIEIADQNNANLVTGFQLEYYPDLDQMEYMRPQLGSYIGFVMQESDFYIESIQPNRHPWAFNYWNPDIMASFVSAWNLELNMQENKAEIYNVSLRPKIDYPLDFWDKDVNNLRYNACQKFGSLDTALLGTKEHLLSQLLE